MMNKMQRLFDLLVKLVVGYVIYQFLDHTLGDKEGKKELREKRNLK